MLLFMVVFMAALDTVGVASIIPFMAVLGKPEMVNSNHWLSMAYTGLGYTDTKDFLFFLGLLVFFLLVFSIAFKALTQWALLRFTYMRNYSLSSRLFKGYLGRPYSWFLTQNSADLGNCILYEVGQVINGVIVPAMQLVAHGFVAIFLILLLIFVDPIVAMTTFGVLGGVYSIIYLVLRKHLGRIGKERVTMNKARFRVTQEVFGGIKEVKIFGVEKESFRRFAKPSIRFARHQANNQIIAQLPHYFLEMVAFGGVLFLTLFLFRTKGNFSQVLPILAVYTMAGYRLLPSLQHVFQFLAKIRFSMPALELLHRNLLDVQNTVLFDNEVKGDLFIPSKEITLKNIHFQYPTAKNVTIHDLNMSFPARSTIGLVGTTGSGKTTIVDLVMGLLQPDKGDLAVDGILIAQHNIRNWQRSLGYVPQQIFLADDSVAANIAYGIPKDKIDMNAVERAAKIVEMHEFISRELPDGYDTLVGERGVRLSGGQRQRIGIARALYHDPAVLIFDEATSALDNLTEQAVMRAIHNLSRDKTIILIAHRLTTVQDCDLIYYLEKGAVIAKGKYSELMTGSELFEKMAGTESLQ